MHRNVWVYAYISVRNREVVKDVKINNTGWSIESSVCLKCLRHVIFILITIHFER